MYNPEISPEQTENVILTDIEALAERKGYILNVVEKNSEKIRLQILGETATNNQIGLGKAEHEQFIADLHAEVPDLNIDAVTVLAWPQGAVNIEIDLSKVNGSQIDNSEVLSNSAKDAADTAEAGKESLESE
ncbi:MAG: hypothetical protein AAB388_01700 [Patescibacteria group bacterium]